MADLLVVEDDPHNLELMVYLLEAAGHAVVPAATGRAAVEAAGEAAGRAAMVGDRDNALNAGFDGYLVKPIDAPSFAQAIDEYLPEPLRGHRPRSRWSVS